MARDIWVTSDTHFLHSNILKFTDDNGELIRGKLFHDVHHMDEVLIQNWNRVVKPGDYVYHLGDVFMGAKEDFMKLWPRLNGSKRLVVGNHDDIKFLSSGGFFSKVMMWRQFKEFGLLLTHVPVHPEHIRGQRNETVNVHGHIHQRPSPLGPYRCLCVEQTKYTPVNIEELRIR